MAVVEIESMLTPSQAARRLEVSSQTVANWIASGRLPSLKTPLGSLVAPKDVERLALQRQQERAARNA